MRNFFNDNTTKFSRNLEKLYYTKTKQKQKLKSN